MIVPLLIEIIQSWTYCRCLDYWDLIFSIIGILTVLLVLTEEKTKQTTT